MSSAYPKVHVVGSGAYYSYRPITRYIEKADRNFIREASSRPKEFSQYLSASSARGDGYTRGSSADKGRDFFRGSSLPPLDTSSEKKRTSQRTDDVFQRAFDDSFFKGDESDSRLSRRGKTDSSSHVRKTERTLRSEMEDESVTTADRNALFTSGDDVLTRLRRKHPYRLAVENEVVPPHESSIWPENRPHFDLVSSYDTMVDFLGIRDKSKK